MKKLLFLTSTLIALFLFSCEKERNNIVKNGQPNFKITDDLHESHHHESYDKKLAHYSILEENLMPVLREKFQPKDVQRIKNSYVGTYHTEEKKSFSFLLESYYEFILKLHVVTNEEYEIENVSVAKIDLFTDRIGEGFATDEMISSVSFMQVEQYLAFKGGGDIDQIETCLSLVFDNSSPGGPANRPNDKPDPGNGPIGGPSGTGVGTSLPSECWRLITVCGCNPNHAGGNSNPNCTCTKANQTVLINICNYGLTSSNNKDLDYWECISVLLHACLLNEMDLLVRRLKNCSLDPNDVDPNGGGNVNQDPADKAFCTDWLSYQAECLPDFNTNEDYDTWASFYFNYPSLFESTISNSSLCLDEGEFECYAALIDFDIKHELNLTQQEGNIILEEVTTCGEGFEEEATLVLFTMKCAQEASSEEAINLEEKMIECFGDINCYDAQNSEFSITLYAEQPVSNSRDNWSGHPLLDNIRVGHTFLELKSLHNYESNNLVFGFYPKWDASIRSGAIPMEIRDDGREPYTVAVTIELTCEEFQEAIAKSLEATQEDYKLKDYNCTSYGIEVANSVGLGVAYTKSPWIFGNTTFGVSVNPGDLGEDIKLLTEGEITLGGIAPKSNCQ